MIAKCPNCKIKLEIHWVGGGFFHCQCKKCGNEFEARKGPSSSKPLIIKGLWPFQKWGAK